MRRGIEKRCAMKTIRLPVCDGCKKPITRPEDGFIVEGSVYTADADMSTRRRGLIGSALPKPVKDGLIKASAIAMTALCRPCFYKALNITFPHSP
jgi:hypothetical protein